jgi:hypothetical protein
VKFFTEELLRVQIPNSVEEVMKNLRWIDAMEVEMKALETTRT